MTKIVFLIENTNAGEATDHLKSSFTAGRIAKLYCCLGKVCLFLTQLNMHLPYFPTIPPLDTYLI